MRSILLSTAAAGCLCLAAAPLAAAQDTTASPPPQSGVTSTAPAPATDAAGYLRQAGLGDLYEIQASQLELSRGHEPHAKDFANRMVADHTQSTQTLVTAASQAGLPAAPPPALDSRRQAMLDQLKSAPTPDFDRLYLQQQLMAHDEALRLHENYAKSGDNAALRPVAGQVAGVVRQHIVMLKDLGAR
jgi:putative membrane protein